MRAYPPRITSSAFPPGKAPTYVAALHDSIDSEEVRSSRLVYSLHDLRIDENCRFTLRNVTNADQTALEQLHGEWFPINYHSKYYQAIYDGTLDSFVIEFRSKGPIEQKKHQEVNKGSSRDSQTYPFLSYFYGLFQLIPRPRPVDTIAGFACVAYDQIIADEDVSRLYTNLVKGALDISREQEELVSQIVCQMYDNLDTETRRKLRQKAAYIVTLGVTIEFRSKGLAAYLLHCIKRRIAARGKLFLYLHCVCYNSNAINMYRKHGFIHTDSLEEYYDIDGVNYDALLLVWYAQENMDHDVRVFVEKCKIEYFYRQSYGTSDFETSWYGRPCNDTLRVTRSESNMNSS